MSERRQRPRSRGGRRSAGEGAAVVMGSERNPDYVERLARKYMRKCKVESSTESESDINNEGPSSTPTHGTSKKTAALKLQFLDPYDGDSEDTSTHSDGSAIFVQDCQATLTENWNLPVCETDVYMRSLANLDTSVETTTRESWGSSVRGTGPSDLSMDSGIITEAPSFNSGHFVLIGVDSRNAHHRGNSVLPLSQSKRTSEDNSDFAMFETSLAKRKLGLKMDDSGEKLRRKKPRVTEIRQ
ncbi:uncharacterized protein LOC142503092 [Ascaphus truei]|uniref:uncharacterized protein LOC142503092 n=1 Tax=Ascaphus truei TaxID=8439 RepID=UPI003F59876D